MSGRKTNQRRISAAGVLGMAVLCAAAGVLGMAVLCAAAGCMSENHADSGSRGPTELSAPPGANGKAQAASAAAKAVEKKGEYGQEEKEKFDPVAVNGKFFEEWPKPKLAIMITGRQDGYLEPCGCAGLENQKGGLSRRHSLVQDLKSRGWTVAGLDAGGLVRRFGKQAELQFNASAAAMRMTDYVAAGFGAADLRLSAGEVAAAIVGDDHNESIFTSANVNLFDLNKRFRIVEIAGLKLGIISVLGAEYQAQVNNSEVQIQPAAEALEQVVGELDKCDLRILLAHATLEESRRLALQFPVFHFVAAAGGPDEPPFQPEEIKGTPSKLIEVGQKGMYAIVLGIYDDPQTPVRYQRVALDSRFPNSAEIKQLFAAYQDQLRQLGWAGLGLRPVAHPRASSEGTTLAGTFAGAAKCQECHPTAFNVWRQTKHAHATQTLEELQPPRQFDPECVACHAGGWNPQQVFPYETGFVSAETTPLLTGNSCENCHGPAAAHVAAEEDRNPLRRDAERQAIRLNTAMAEKNLCVACHDHDNSPKFDFNAYWPKVAHPGKR